MKLNLNKILARTHVLYKNLKLEKGYSQEEVDKMTIRSDQVVALAKALVEALNKEFGSKKD